MPVDSRRHAITAQLVRLMQGSRPTGQDVEGFRCRGNALGTRGTQLDRHHRPRAFEHSQGRGPRVRTVKPIENAVVSIEVLPSTGIEGDGALVIELHEHDENAVIRRVVEQCQGRSRL